MIKSNTDGYELICDGCQRSFNYELDMSAFPTCESAIQVSTAFDWRHDGRNRCNICALVATEVAL